MKWLNKIDSFSFIVGRSLLGLYFVGPGLSKVFDYAGTLALMKIKGVPFSSILLPLTIGIQILGGLCLILGRSFVVYKIDKVRLKASENYLYATGEPFSALANCRVE